jgi:hypothetical protein
LSAVAIALIIAFGGLDVMGGIMTFGSLVAFIQYAQRFYRPISDLSEKYNVLQSAMASSERIFGVLDREPRIVDAASPATIPPTPSEVVFDHVLVHLRDRRRGAARRELQGGARARRWRSWATQARGRPPSSACSRASTMVNQGRILIDGRDRARIPLERPAPSHRHRTAGRVPVLGQRGAQHPSWKHGDQRRENSRGGALHQRGKIH